MKKQKLDEIVKELIRSYKRHLTILEHGSSDPHWDDGTNLNLVHNHILYYRRKINELCESEHHELPKILTVPVPPKVHVNFNSDHVTLYPTHPFYDAERLGEADIKKITTPAFEQLALF